MPAAIDPEKREQVILAIRHGGRRNQIARDVGVSPATVTSIAQQEGIDEAFDRTSTERATEARSADLAANRLELAHLLMQDAFDLHDRAWSKQQVTVQYKDRSEVVDVDSSAADFRNFYVAIGIIVDKVAVLTRDESEGMSAVDSWLRSVIGGGASAA